MKRALVYGDVNLNILDGSAIWAQSMVQALSEAGLEVTLLLKAKVVNPRLVEPLERLPRVTLARPVEGGAVGPSREALTVPQAIDEMQRLDRDHRFDVVVMRGMQAVKRAVDSSAFDGRLWTYLTDIPQSAVDLTPALIDDLDRICGASRFMLCQTEQLRGYLESVVPSAGGRCVIWTPLVPPLEFALPKRVDMGGAPVRLVYTGKFAPLWNTWEMTALPRMLADRGVAAEVHMVGDKIHSVPDDPGYAARMRDALSQGDGVVWHGGMPRQAAMELSASMDIGLSWRDPAMNASLELSTKVLEFGALGVPVIMNRTDMHEELYGADYPLFADSASEVVEVVARVVADRGLWILALERCREVSDAHTLAVAVERVREYVAAAFPSAGAMSEPLVARGRRTKVLVASHDLKFFGEILQHLRALPELEVRVDHWSALAVNDEKSSRELLEWADVIICEWCGPVAVWYSRNKRARQRLLVRFHRFEINGPWLDDVRFDNVDQLVCVSPHFAQVVVRETGWDADRVVVIPNGLDARQLDRPKLPGARHHLGMIGIIPRLKRFDRALDVVETLRREDERFTLFVKSKMAWDVPWIWRNEEEQQHYRDALFRVRTSRFLRGGVVFDAFGNNVPSWLRRIGWVLSTSDIESFHLAPAEGMASRAVPAVLPWDGASTIYADEWIVPDTDAMARSIGDTIADDRWVERGMRARAQVERSLEWSAVCATWTGLLVSDLPPGSSVGTLAPGGHAAEATT